MFLSKAGKVIKEDKIDIQTGMIKQMLENQIKKENQQDFKKSIDNVKIKDGKVKAKNVTLEEAMDSIKIKMERI